MITNLLVQIALALTASWAPSTQNPPASQETPMNVSICDLQNDPAKYNRRLVKFTGFISHGFEDFAVFDPTCHSRQSIWLEYGGTKASDTMYCCGVVPGHTRPKNISVDGISIPLIEDGQFRQLDAMIRAKHDLVMHASIIGRFFAGEKQGEFWSGYGHMGCCALLVIQQVVSVDSQNRPNLDYGASADQPNIEKEGCGYRILSRDWRFSDALELQRKAESGERSWAFDDPARVAREVLAGEAGSTARDADLTQTRQIDGRRVYKWQPKNADSSYMVVVSRPYTLSFYAANPERVSWIPIAAYRVGCSNDNTVTTYRLPRRNKNPRKKRH